MINGDYVKNLIKNIPLGIAISNGDGLIKDVNLKFLDMFGYLPKSCKENLFQTYLMDLI